MSGQRMNNANPDPLFSATTAAEYLGLGEVVRHPGQSIRRLCRLGKIASTRVAGEVMIRKSAPDAYLGSHGNGAAPEDEPSFGDLWA